jgi:hypothetical protein
VWPQQILEDYPNYFGKVELGGDKAMSKPIHLFVLLC